MDRLRDLSRVKFRYRTKRMTNEIWWTLFENSSWTKNSTRKEFLDFEKNKQFVFDRYRLSSFSQFYIMNFLTIKKEFIMSLILSSLAHICRLSNFLEKMLSIEFFENMSRILKLKIVQECSKSRETKKQLTTSDTSYVDRLRSTNLYRTTNSTNRTVRIVFQ